MTGVKNRRGFERELARLHENLTGGARLCIAVVAVTNAKDVYDTYGLSCGDHVLREGATRVIRAVDEPAIVGRMDSNIFAVCFPDVYTDGEVQACVSQMSRSLKTVSVTDALQVHLRISIGMASYPEDCPIPDELLACAWPRWRKAPRRSMTRWHAIPPKMTMELQRKRNIQSQ